jgi:hypothetical protein
LNQASRVCVVSFEQFGGSVLMPRGLLVITRCGGAAFRAWARYGHVSSELVMRL